MQTMTGYLHPKYAQSLAEFGRPRELPHCQGWVLERQIPGFPDRDGMGSYPIFACQDWSRLPMDLETLGKDLVSLSLVTDPFGEYDMDCLRRFFGDVVIPFKQHFIVDLDRPMETFVCQHHRRYAHKALQDVFIDRGDTPLSYLNEWSDLYGTLIERHRIRGIAAFSKRCFAQQLGIPGIVVFRALHEKTTVGMLLWYVQGEVGYYHLGAYSPPGYELRASFALFWFAIKHFIDQGFRWLNLGAGTGVEENSKDGLNRFKRGWATGTRLAYFCGRIFNQARYSEIMRAKGISEVDYFPSYRRGEFGSPS
jgi:hypothetical protein